MGREEVGEAVSARARKLVFFKYLRFAGFARTRDTKSTESHHAIQTNVTSRLRRLSIDREASLARER